MFPVTLLQARKVARSWGCPVSLPVASCLPLPCSLWPLGRSVLGVPCFLLLFFIYGRPSIVWSFSRSSGIFGGGTSALASAVCLRVLPLRVLVARLSLSRMQWVEPWLGTLRMSRKWLLGFCVFWQPFLRLFCPLGVGGRHVCSLCACICGCCQGAEGLPTKKYKEKQTTL